MPFIGAKAPITRHFQSPTEMSGLINVNIMLASAFRLENITDASSSALALKLRYQLIAYYRESVYCR
jgi:hypothetical protein